jgi:hypothetical protein
MYSRDTCSSKDCRVDLPTAPRCRERHRSGRGQHARWPGATPPRRPHQHRHLPRLSRTPAGAAACEYGGTPPGSPAVFPAWIGSRALALRPLQLQQHGLDIFIGAVCAADPQPRHPFILAHRDACAYGLAPCRKLHQRRPVGSPKHPPAAVLCYLVPRPAAHTLPFRSSLDPSRLDPHGRTVPPQNYCLHVRNFRTECPPGRSVTAGAHSRAARHIAQCHNDLWAVRTVRHEARPCSCGSH